MSSGVFGGGIIPGTPSPALYSALVAYFGGDKDAAAAWLAAWESYATSDEAEELLAALIAFGPPVAVESKLDTQLDARPVGAPVVYIAPATGTFTPSESTSYLYTVIAP